MATPNFSSRMRLRIPRSDDSERVSAAQTSVASALLSTRSFQRGWVSQTISAFGKDSRRAATAGKACTISPSELRRTTRNFGSAMRRLADGFEKIARRVILGITHNGYADAQPRGHSAFRHTFHRVVRAFRVNVRPQLFQEYFHIDFGEEHDVVYAAERRNELCASVFIENRPAWPLQAAHAGIGIHANHENIAFAARTFEIADMADVQ